MILCHGSALRFASATIGSESQALKMGTPKSARWKGLASSKKSQIKIRGRKERIF